ncbi:MAG TPA: hypothetical protein VEB60_01780 [Candidatus Paceibacterota bacterium]|nr:hypothetical protein [Candidatus Paceibacterota bacterium]
MENPHFESPQEVRSGGKDLIELKERLGTVSSVDELERVLAEIKEVLIGKYELTGDQADNVMLALAPFKLMFPIMGGVSESLLPRAFELVESRIGDFERLNRITRT